MLASSTRRRDFALTVHEYGRDHGAKLSAVKLFIAAKFDLVEVLLTFLLNLLNGVRAWRNNAKDCDVCHYLVRSFATRPFSAMFQKINLIRCYFYKGGMAFCL
jgi:hypothetical protein